MLFKTLATRALNHVHPEVQDSHGIAGLYQSVNILYGLAGTMGADTSTRCLYVIDSGS